MIEKEAVSITEDEAALYDRQIRLWGLDAQKRLRAARILMIGLGGLGAEVVKNIVLSGVKSVLLLDHVLLSEEDLCSQFLFDRKDLGQNRAKSSLKKTQLLNPMVEVSYDTENSENKNEAFFCSFDVVCITCCGKKELTRINEICSKNNIMFFAGDVFGYYGYMFADLNNHEYAEDVPSNKKSGGGGRGEPPAKKPHIEEEEKRTIKKEASFVRLENALCVNWASEPNLGKLKKTPALYFILKIVLEFHSRIGRYPNTAHLESDRNQLQFLRTDWLPTLGIDPQLISDDFWKYCFAQLSPVCAITGGILGQEIIKAVSKKDAPHNNFFFFSGLDSTGYVDRIG